MRITDLLIGVGVFLFVIGFCVCIAACNGIRESTHSAVYYADNISERSAFVEEFNTGTVIHIESEPYVNDVVEV